MGESEGETGRETGRQREGVGEREREGVSDGGWATERGRGGRERERE